IRRSQMKPPNPWTVPLIVVALVVAGVILYDRRPTPSFVERVRWHLTTRGWEWVQYEPSGYDFDLPDNFVVAKKGPNLYVVVLDQTRQRLHILTYRGISSLPQRADGDAKVAPWCWGEYEYDESFQLVRQERLYCPPPPERKYEVLGPTQELAQAIL